MPAPEIGKWLDVLYYVGVGIAAVLMGFFGRVLQQKRVTGNSSVTHSHLVQLHREIDGEREKDRHYARGDLQKLSAQNELECQRIESNVAEAAKGLAGRLETIGEGLNDLKSNVAVLMDRSERWDKLEERVERLEGRRR